MWITIMISKVYFEESTALEMVAMAAGAGLVLFGCFEVFQDLTQGMVMQFFGLYILNQTQSGIRNRWLMEALEEEED
jgi:hypothetical protein